MRRSGMKRLWFVLLATLGILLCMTATALAETTQGYTTWTAGPPNDTSAATPHKDYQTTTMKCGVCHAVHQAPAGGELLLRGAAGDACVYCHITTDTGVVQIYNGDAANYYDDNSRNHSLEGGAACSGCHSVHGADTYGGKLTTKILKRLPIQPEYVRFFSESSDSEYLYTLSTDDSIYGAPPYDWEEWGQASTVQETAFCTGCHPFFTHASEEYITTDRMIVNGAISTETPTFASHPMKRYWADADMNISFEASGSTIPTSTQVAGMSTNGCHRCHGEGDYVNLGAGVWESSFPHYTPNRDRFLISSDSDGNWIDTQNAKEDGTCFHCHVAYTDAEGNPAGVGISY